MEQQHYSYAQSLTHLREWAEQVAKQMIDPMCGQMGFLLCYQGMSGVGTATALGLALEGRGATVGMVYVRKHNEQSHGSRTAEVSIDKLLDRIVHRVELVFVDDFVCTGETFDRVRKITHAVLPSSLAPKLARGWSKATTGINNGLRAGTAYNTGYIHTGFPVDIDTRDKEVDNVAQS